MGKFLGYRCSLCGTEYLPGQVTYTCPKDGGNLDIALDTEAIKKKFHYEDITSRDEPSLWRYAPLLPVFVPKGEATPLHLAGWTPVFKLPRLAEKLGLDHLWLKDESRNPSASFKDRASAIVVARAQELKSEIIVTASTGNAGAAYLDERVAELPTPKPRKALPTKKTAMLVLRHNTHILLEKRPEKGIWGGLLSLPEIALDADISQVIQANFKTDIASHLPLAAFTHAFTHFKLDIHPHVVEIAHSPKNLPEKYYWLTLESAMQAAIPTPIRYILQILNDQMGH